MLSHFNVVANICQGIFCPNEVKFVPPAIGTVYLIQIVTGWLSAIELYKLGIQPKSDQESWKLKSWRYPVTIILTGLIC